MGAVVVPHGTRVGYTGTRKRPGCRCDECRAAQSEYHRSYRDRPGYRGPQKRIQAWVDAQKDAPCMDCGGRFPPECMDFDHVRGQKKFNISHVAKAVKNFDRLKNEIANCDLVCANCHRIRTRSRRLEGCPNG